MIVLDTHAWLWWVDGRSGLSHRARETIDVAAGENTLLVSSISAWEVALLVACGRLELSMAPDDWVARSEDLPFLRFIPVSNAIALRSVALPPPLHADPADRIIVATALIHGARLVTKDRRLRTYSRIETIW